MEHPTIRDVLNDVADGFEIIAELLTEVLARDEEHMSPVSIS